jgi:hypothetical protein
MSPTTQHPQIEGRVKSDQELMKVAREYYKAETLDEMLNVLIANGMVREDEKSYISTMSKADGEMFYALVEKQKTTIN